MATIESTATKQPEPEEPRTGRGKLLARLQQPTFLTLTVLVLTVLVVLPLVMLLYGSLRDSSPGQPGSFTLGNYDLLATGEFWELVRTSLVIGVGSTLLSMLIGGAMAAIIVRVDIPKPGLWDALVMVPAYMTPFIGALGWTLLLSPQIGYLNTVSGWLGIPPFDIYSIPGIIWVLSLYYAPIAYLYIRPALYRLDRSFEESSRVLGANARQTMRRIIVPLSLPSLLSATLVVFVNALGNFGVPGVLGRPAQIDVLPTALVRMVTLHPSDPNGAAVLGVALTLVTIGGLWISNRILRRRDFTTVTAQGGVTPIKLRLGWLRFAATGVCLLYVVIAVVLPIGVMALASFQPYLTTDIGVAGFTLANYEFVFTYPAVARSITNSVWLGISAAIGGSIMSILVAYIVVRTGWRGRSYVEYAGTSPLAIPHTVFGLAMLWMWVTIPIGVYGTRWVLWLAYTALFLPYSVRAALAGFRQIDASLEDASRVLGGSWLVSLRMIIAPMLRPAILSGAIMILYHAVRELPASLMLYSVGSEVMSVMIWDMYREGRFVQLFALAMVNLAIVIPLVALATYFGRGQER